MFSVESVGVKLWFTNHIFFRTAVLRKLFEIRFSYKHCNFSSVCLLVKMASKSVTRSTGKKKPEKNQGFKVNCDLKLVAPHTNRRGFVRLYFPFTEIERVKCFNIS